MSYSITSMQREILVMLEEAGEENFPTILNSLALSSERNIQLTYKVDLEIFAANLLQMLRNNLVKIDGIKFPNSLEAFFTWLSELVTVDVHLKRWTSTNEENIKPVLSITKQGIKLVAE